MAHWEMGIPENSGRRFSDNNLARPEPTGQYWFGTPVQSNKAWLDDIVISTERIGCQ